MQTWQQSIIDCEAYIDIAIDNNPRIDIELIIAKAFMVIGSILLCSSLKYSLNYSLHSEVEYNLSPLSSLSCRG